ncbi:MAG: hydroxyisourate hydrolase [Synechococcales cyanobacterium]
MASLTTHVLDTAQGKPAAGMAVRLVKINPLPETLVTLKTVVTNQDGRVDTPLLTEADMQVGVYELWFEVGAYFRQQGLAVSDPPFLDQVPIRFAIGDPAAHYHVPLLVSPWSYTTYRGS